MPRTSGCFVRYARIPAPRLGNSSFCWTTFSAGDNSRLAGKSFSYRSGRRPFSQSFTAVGIGKVGLDPCRRFHVPLFGGVRTPRLSRNASASSLRHADHLVLRDDVHLDAALFHRALHRLHDHWFGRRRGDEGHGLAGLRDPEAGALKSGLVADERANVRRGSSSTDVTGFRYRGTAAPGIAPAWSTRRRPARSHRRRIPRQWPSPPRAPRRNGYCGDVRAAKGHTIESGNAGFRL